MHLRWILTAALTIVVGSGTARAQSSKAEIEAAKREAVAIADKGVEAFRGEKYQEAIDAFRRADQRFHVPKFLLYVARSQVKLGKLVDAKSTYRSIVDEKLASYAPEEFLAAQADAKKELAELTPRIPTLRITAVTGVGRVTVDGRAATAGEALSLDPGSHVIEGEGAEPARQTVTLAEGQSETVTLQPRPARPEPTVEPPITTGNAAPGGGPPAGTYVAFGVGAAGLVVGAVFGGLTLAKKGEFDRLPTTETADQGEAFSHVADAGFALAIAGAAAGAVVWVVSSRGSGDKASSPPAKTMFLAPRGPGLTFGGTF